MLGETTRPSLLRNVMLRVVEQAQAPVLPVGVCVPQRTLCSLTMHKQNQQIISMERGHARFRAFDHSF